jgi:hypothetical protein
MKRWFRLPVAVGVLVAGSASLTRAGADYPLARVFDAQVKSDTTTITSRVTIRVDRLMEESRRTRVTDALRYGGYPNFFNALRGLPPVGSIEVESRSVEVRYAHEQPADGGQRLVLVADRPLFFLGVDKSRAGYELTVVELRFDARGGVTGTMSGAARVKPTPDGGVQLDDFADTPVGLTLRPGTR